MTHFRKSTSINNFIPPSMETNLPSLTRYYSLNRVGKPVNNLDLVNRNNNAVNQRHNVYATMGHRGGNVRIIAPQDQEMFNVRGESRGSGDNYEATYNVSSTSDYNTISVSDESTDNQTLIRNSGLEVRGLLGLQRVARGVRMAVFIFAILSPIIMITLPKMELLGLKHSQLKCGVGCEGLKISIIFKLILLVLCWWAVQLRSQVTGPRPDLARTVLSGLVVLLLTVHWSLYLSQLSPDNRVSLQYEAVVDCAGGLVTALLSLLLLGLPACTKSSNGPRAPVQLTRLTIALTFLSSLVSVVLVVSLVSWLSVGTFWLAHSRIRLEVDQEAECSLTLLVITGITVFLSWTGLLSGLIMNNHL